MTLSISATEPKRGRALKTARAYLAAALFCGLFSFVYEQFSHGVYSHYMVYLFLFPLLGGALPFGLAWLLNGRFFPGRLSFNLYNSGVAALAVGSCLSGVLEIYGTTSDYVIVYWIAGAALSASGLLCFLGSLFLRPPVRSA